MTVLPCPRYPQPAVTLRVSSRSELWGSFIAARKDHSAVNRTEDSESRRSERRRPSIAEWARWSAIEGRGIRGQSLKRAPEFSVRYCGVCMMASEWKKRPGYSIFISFIYRADASLMFMRDSNWPGSGSPILDRGKTFAPRSLRCRFASRHV